MGQFSPFILPLLSVALSAGSAAYGQSRSKSEASRARRRARGEYFRWQESAFPSQQEKEAATGQLGQARLGAYQNLASSMAARGFGPGSGYAYKLASDIERGYGQSYANMLAQMQQPKYPPPTGFGYTPQGGADWTQALSGGLNQALGYYWMSRMLQGMQPTTTSIPFFGR